MTLLLVGSEHARAFAPRLVEVASLNARVSDAIVEQINRVRKAGALAPSSSLLVLGPAGAGKTHLFERMRRKVGAGATFRPMLNPGHLISYDEWVHSPIERGSEIPLASGMTLQCDIIPTPLPAGTALNCEDTVVLADAALRHEIAARHPELWARIGRTRDLMRDELGLTLRPETLPLSLANAYLPPGWLAPDRVCALA